MGIALILLGSLISNTEQKVISRNMLNVDLGKDFPNQENILLYQGDTLAMGSYYVTYKGKEKEGVNLFYTIQYFEINSKTGKLEEAFVLKPIVQLNDRMGNVSEPATKKFINGDIYTHITFAEMDDKDIKKEAEEGYKKPTINTIAIGDTIITSNSIITLDSISKNTNKAALFLNEDDIAVTAYLNIVDINKKQYLATPTYIIRKGQISSKEDKVDALGLLIGFVKINPEDSKFDIAIAEKKSNSREFIIMKAIIFPQINILWFGCLLMIIGTVTAIIKRIRDIQKA
jgi:cytochrome c-type biogenesis protein CcmF